MPRCWPRASASVDLPAPIMPAMPMKMLPSTSASAAVRRAGPDPSPSAGLKLSRSSLRTGSICTRAACQTAMTSSLAAALVAHHALDHALARLRDLARFAQPVGAVRAHLARLARDLDGHELGHLV